LVNLNKIIGQTKEQTAMSVLELTQDIMSKVEQFHEGMHYYIARDVRTVFEAQRLLKDLGLNPHQYALAHTITRKNWYTCQMEIVYYGSYDFILSGTENDQMPCNIANYSDTMQSLQFFVNKEKGTFGRPHGLKGYRPFYIAC
jgi:hypothetical protein